MTLENMIEINKTSWIYFSDKILYDEYIIETYRSVFRFYLFVAELVMLLSSN